MFLGLMDGCMHILLINVKKVYNSLLGKDNAPGTTELVRREGEGFCHSLNENFKTFLYFHSFNFKSKILSLVHL